MLCPPAPAGGTRERRTFGFITDLLSGLLLCLCLKLLYIRGSFSFLATAVIDYTADVRLVFEKTSLVLS